MTLYVSVDLETSGTNPVTNGILSIGACARYAEGSKHLGDFYLNLQMPPDRLWDADTRWWWGKQSLEAQAAIKVEPLLDPGLALGQFTQWLTTCIGEDERVYLVCCPASFDYTFLTNYISTYATSPQWEWWRAYVRVIDVPSMVVALTQRADALKRSGWPKEWVGVAEGVAHNALDDARMQMKQFLRVLEWAKNNVPPA